MKEMTTDELFSDKPVEEVVETSPKTEEVVEEVKAVETGDPKDTDEEQPEIPEVEVEADKDWKKEFETAMKRLEDTQKWGNEANMKAVEAEKALNAKQIELGEVEEPSTDDAVTEKVFSARLETSHVAAVQMYGEDTVNKMLYAPDSPFQKLNRDPVIHARVRSSLVPTLEAMKVVKEQEFLEKYGGDVTKIEENMRKQIQQEFNEKLSKSKQEKLLSKEKLPKGLKDVPSEVVTKEDTSTFREPTTSEIFDTG